MTALLVNKTAEAFVPNRSVRVSLMLSLWVNEVNFAVAIKFGFIKTNKSKVEKVIKMYFFYVCQSGVSAWL